jgi:hypothetical protein
VYFGGRIKSIKGLNSLVCWPDAMQEGSTMIKDGKITVGEFQYDHATESIIGPKEYLNSDSCQRKFDAIKSGRDTVVNFGLAQGGDVVTTTLVALQTDYAGWLGMRQFCKSNNIS